MTCGPRTDRPPTYKNIRLIYFTCLFQKPINCFCIFENLLRSLLRFISCYLLGVVLLIDPVPRILHTKNVDLKLLDHLLHQRLRQSDIFSVCVEMNENLLALAFEIQAWDKVLWLVAWCLFFEPYKLLLFIDLLPLILLLLVLLWLQLFYLIQCRFALHWYRTLLYIKRIRAWYRSHDRFSEARVSMAHSFWSVDSSLIPWRIRLVQLSRKHHLSRYRVEMLCSLWNFDATFSLIALLVQVLQGFQILCFHQVYRLLILSFGLNWHLILNVSWKAWRLSILQYSISLLSWMESIFHLLVTFLLYFRILCTVPPLYGIEVVKSHITAQLRQSRKAILRLLLYDIREKLLWHAGWRH